MIIAFIVEKLRRICTCVAIAHLQVSLLLAHLGETHFYFDAMRSVQNIDVSFNTFACLISCIFPVIPAIIKIIRPNSHFCRCLPLIRQ